MIDKNGSMKISKHETLWLQNEGAKMIAALGIEAGNSVIDFGSGQGRYTIPIAQVVGKNGYVYAIEHDKNETAILLSRLHGFLETNNIRVIETNILKNKQAITQSTIDSILIFDVLQYIEDWDFLFNSFSQMLKTNGLIHIYPAEVPHPRSVDINIAIPKLQKFGFEHINSTKYKMMHNVDMVDDMVYSFRLK